MGLHELLQYALDKQSSDLHLSAEVAPWVRIDGKLLETELPIIAGPKLEEMLLACMDEQARIQFVDSSEVDFAQIL